MRARILHLFVCLFALTLVLPAHSQFGLGKKNKGPADKAPELTDADKKKMAEIEQRPEVQLAIQAEWDIARKNDLTYVYAVNSSARYSRGSFAQALEFNEKYGQLYDNPMMQRYLNGVGQKLVPKDSPNLYSFRLLLDPVPQAEALTTGTIYVSTGMVALLNNEAQLSYVLAHEIAHVEKNHRYTKIKNSIVQAKLNEEKEHDLDKKRMYLSAATAVAGAALGGITGGGSGAALGGIAGFAGGEIAAHLLIRAKTTVTEWDELDENEADEAALPYMLNQNYDAREIPRLFTRMASLSKKDSRAGLGFVAKPERVKLRSAHMEKLLAGASKADIDAKLKAGGLVASTPEFPLLMAALKRDNGIIAMDYDLFEEARDNLEDAVSLRSDDARAQVYLGKVMSLTARSAEDRQQAMEHFNKAIHYDEARGAYPDPHLERVIDMLGQNNPAQQPEIRHEIEMYVALYQRENGGALPSNMPILYDYMQLAGDTTWYTAPTSVVSTKFVEPLHVSSSGMTAAASGPEVLRISTGSTVAVAPAPVADTKAAAPAKPVKKTAGGSK